ncbi:MAG: FKBP-type peptidyl-prolyl cis-trans isomerase [Deltaproteobacteria bacterium]|nr:MAG: FKBP-type peptidyl-prolyl cis-trans isomerase [Deltaproteobacteria bacterium]
MRQRWLIGLGTVIIFLACQAGAQEPPALKDQKDKVSYSIGMEIGKNLKKQSIDVNPELLARGVKDAFSDGKALMTDQEMNEALVNFQKEMMAKQQEGAKKLGEKNKTEGEAFLAENKKKEGMITVPSGLQYKVMKAGSGKKPKATDTVTVHYRGTLIDGTEFDSSYKRGQPVSFPVNGVIPGWSEAVQMMEEGAKWQIFVPSNLAYGERGAGRDIGPHATLIFEIELISIQEKK